MVRVIHLMQRRAAVKSDTTLREVAHKIMYTGLPGIPVVNNEREIVGVITEIDFIRAIKNGMNVDEITAEKIMTTDPVTADIEDSVDNVMELMLKSNFTMIPILKNSKLAGVLSRDAIMEAFLEPDIWQHAE